MSDEERDLSADEYASVELALKSLRDHFPEWKHNNSDYELIEFAYYEGCGRDKHCSDVLQKAAKFALGQELVSKYNFTWLMVRKENSWSYAVTHWVLDRHIILSSLEDGRWVDDEYDEEPAPGQRTIDSLEYIVDVARHVRQEPQ